MNSTKEYTLSPVLPRRTNLIKGEEENTFTLLSRKKE
jgi:hypothetical protein